MVSPRLAPVRARLLCWVGTDAGRAWPGGTTTKLASRIPARSHEPVEVVKRGTNFEACMSDKKSRCERPDAGFEHGISVDAKPKGIHFFIHPFTKYYLGIVHQDFQ